MMRTIIAIGCLGFIAITPVGAAEVQCPPGAGDVSARVLPEVTYDEEDGTYIYRYSLESQRSSTLPVNGIMVEVANGDVGGVNAPDGWSGLPRTGTNGSPDVVDWYASRVKNPDEIDPDDASIPKSIAALEPGESLGGFVLRSPLPPGPKRAYVTGQIPREPVSDEREMEELYQQCDSVRGTLREQAKRVRTAGPGEGNFEPIAVDIKPGSAANPVNPNQQGVVPVALLGSPDRDVTQIDVTTLAFGPGGAGAAHSGHEPTDINGDGELDRLVHFDASTAGIECLDAVAFVRGKTADGTTIQGFDTITLPTCNTSSRATGQDNTAGKKRE